MSATLEARRDGLRSPSRLSKVLLLAAASLGAIHLVDHVLRADHSGWPFLDEVTPFTFFAVAVLPVILFAHFDRSRPVSARRRPIRPCLPRGARGSIRRVGDERQYRALRAGTAQPAQRRIAH